MARRVAAWWWLLVSFAAFTVGTLGAVWPAYEFATARSDAVATVDSKNGCTGRDQNRLCDVDYSFVTPDGAPYSGTGELPADQWNRTATGSSLRVRYVLRDPAQNHIAGRDETQDLLIKAALDLAALMAVLWFGWYSVTGRTPRIVLRRSRPTPL